MKYRLEPLVFAHDDGKSPCCVTCISCDTAVLEWYGRRAMECGLYG